MRTKAMTLEESLKKCRETAEIPQLEVARALGISQFAVSQWETGGRKPSIDRLKQLEDLYGCTIDQLVGRTSE